MAGSADTVRVARGIQQSTIMLLFVPWIMIAVGVYILWSRQVGAASPGEAGE